eukprot:COSAG04_NODE_1443_length_6735_cov_6.847348_4_plen_127_part_00
MENGAKTSHDNGFAPTWDKLFLTLAAADPYGRQMSIHNGPLLYNHSMPYITHVSLQGHEDDTPALRSKYGKPTIWDEVQCKMVILSRVVALPVSLIPKVSLLQTKATSPAVGVRCPAKRRRIASSG